jgi:Rrf2 family transcriptional regulator, iron-sulfur cluster assembly transcription factor
MISKTGVHAIKALCSLSNLSEGIYAGTCDIADEIGAPQNYLGKLLQTLANDGLLISQKGKGGGFRLARAPSKISLYDIINPIEHLSRWTNCLLGPGQCSNNNACALHNKWGKVRDAYLEFLRETTIADVALKKTSSMQTM